MSLQRDLSDKITELFCLGAGEFDPEIHLPLAEFIVDQIGSKRSYFFRLTDLLHVEAKRLGIDLDSAKISAGLYTVQHLGRLSGSAHLGHYPKLSIIHWKSECFLMPWDPIEKLDISYKGKIVKGLRRYTERPHTLSLGSLHISANTTTELWRYVTYCKLEDVMNKIF